MTHICVSKLTIIGADNDLSPGRRQAIIWTNAGILLIGPLRTNFSEIAIGILTYLLKKIRLKMSFAKCCSFTKVFCTYVSNLVILAWTADELSCGKASDWYTHRHTHTLTDTQTGAMTIPEGQNWPRVKNGTQKVRVPIELTCHGRWQLYISLQWH